MGCLQAQLTGEYLGATLVIIFLLKDHMNENDNKQESSSTSSGMILGGLKENIQLTSWNLNIRSVGLYF